MRCSATLHPRDPAGWQHGYWGVPLPSLGWGPPLVPLPCRPKEEIKKHIRSQRPQVRPVLNKADVWFAVHGLCSMTAVMSCTGTDDNAQFPDISFHGNWSLGVQSSCLTRLSQSWWGITALYPTCRCQRQLIRTTAGIRDYPLSVWLKQKLTVDAFAKQLKVEFCTSILTYHTQLSQLSLTSGAWTAMKQQSK